MNEVVIRDLLFGSTWNFEHKILKVCSLKRSHEICFDFLTHHNAYNTLKLFQNEVPVEEDRVLGTEFFQDDNTNINYTSKCLEIENHCYPFKSTNTSTIPARKVTTFYVQIKNTEKSEGYILRLHIQDGVYVGDAVVKNHEGKAYLKFANTNEMPITLSVPIVKLEDFWKHKCHEQIPNLHNFKQTNNEDLSSKIINNFLRTENSPINSCKIYNVTDEDRVECIKKLLRLDHLNQDEYEHEEKLI